jgi:hypothetical protein
MNRSNVELKVQSSGTDSGMFAGCPQMASALLET